MRSLLTLYTLLLETFNARVDYEVEDDVTLCGTIMFHLDTSDDEHSLLMNDFTKRCKPSNLGLNDLWFKNAEERIKALEQIIKELQDNSLTEDK